MADRLVVALHGKQVGLAAPVGAGRLEFGYDSEIVEVMQGRPLLSLSLPVRPEPYSADECMPFFAGLLPEERVRAAIARRFRINEGDVAGLLAELGWECAGAVSVTPEGTGLDRADSVEWLDEAALDTILDELPINPFGNDPAHGVRISLAGAQEKLVVVIGDDGRIGLPVGHTPSTHILKPPSSVFTGRGRPAYPDLVANEAFCLLLARECGVNTASAEVRQVAGRPVLVVERYDRERDPTSGALRWLHQEDACQALGVMPQNKYEEDGGPSAERIVRLLRDRSQTVQRDLPAFIERLLFAVVCGNGDAHAKNYSLFLDSGPRLAPAYDLVSTAVYATLSRRLAMSVGGQFQGDQVTARHWANFLRDCRLDTAEMRRRLARFAEKVADLAPAVAAGVDERGLGGEVVKAIVATVHTRAPQITRLPEWRSDRLPSRGDAV